MKCVVIICQLRALAALAMGEILSGMKGRRKNVIGAGICVRIRRRRVLVEDENRLRRRKTTHTFCTIQVGGADIRSELK